MTHAATPTTAADALRLLDDEPTDVAEGMAFTRTGRPPGTAPALLLVHGVGSARSVWSPILPALARRHHVVVVDLPGHGRSAPLDPRDGADCAALARRLARAWTALDGGGPDGDRRRPHVVGNSLGGWIGLELAADGDASSLVALAPAGLRLRPVPPGPVLRLNRALARRTRGFVAPLLEVGAIRRATFATVSARPGAVPTELARSAAANLARCSDYERMLSAATRRRFERGREIRVPTVIVFGDRDVILPPGAQRPELAPAQAEWIRLPRCGHTPMWDAVEQTIDIVTRTVEDAEARLTATADGRPG